MQIVLACTISVKECSFSSLRARPREPEHVVSTCVMVTGEFPIQLVGRLPPPTLGLFHQLCALPHQLLSDLIVFWLQNEHFPPQARKAIGFEDFGT